MSAPSKLVERAREAAKKKNYDYAVELYIEHLKVKPGDVESRKERRSFERIIKAIPVDIEANNMVRDIPAAMTSRKVQGTDGGVKSYKDLIDQDAAKKLELLSARVRTPEQALERIALQEKEIAEKGGK